MNILFRIYCRGFQGLMRLILPLLPYRRPELLSGWEAAATLLNKESIGRVLLVTGPKVRSLGLTAPLEEALEAAGIGCQVYDRTASNPTIANVEEARELYLQEGDLLDEEGE